METKNRVSASTLFAALVVMLFCTAYSHAGFIAETRTFDVEADINDLIVGPFVPPPLTSLETVKVSWALDLTGDASAELCLTFQDCEPGDVSFFIYIADSQVPPFALGPRDFEEPGSDFGGFTNDTDDLQTGTSTLIWNDMTVFTGNDLDFFLTGGTMAFDISAFVDGCCGVETSGGGTVTIDYYVPEPATLALLGLGVAGIGYGRRKVKAA